MLYLSYVSHLVTLFCICRFIPNGCEVDIRIPESFPQESLEEFILAFAKVSIELNVEEISSFVSQILSLHTE